MMLRKRLSTINTHIKLLYDELVKDITMVVTYDEDVERLYRWAKMNYISPTQYNKLTEIFKQTVKNKLKIGAEELLVLDLVGFASLQEKMEKEKFEKEGVWSED